MNKLVKCPKCGKETKININDFSGIEIVLCDDIYCENLFAVSWESDIKMEVLNMAQPNLK